MRKHSPDFRYREVRAAKEMPEHMLEASLWHIVLGNVDNSDNNTRYAWEIFSEMHEREILNAFLVAGATNDEIYIALRVPLDVIDAYRHLFFDVTAFRDELHLLSWVRNYEENEEGTRHGTQLLKQAFESGVPGLLWLYCRKTAEILNVDAEDVQRRVMIDAFFRGRANRLFPLASDEAKAAKGYMDMAVKVALVLSKKVNTTGLNDLLIKLRHRDMTSSVEDIRPEDAPLH